MAMTRKILTLLACCVLATTATGCSKQDDPGGERTVPVPSSTPSTDEPWPAEGECWTIDTWVGDWEDVDPNDPRWCEGPGEPGGKPDTESWSHGETDADRAGQPIDYGWSRSQPNKPATGPTEAELKIASQNAVSFLVAIRESGAGDKSPWDALTKALPYAGEPLTTRLKNDIAASKRGEGNRFWQEDVDAGIRTQVMIHDIFWADWSHPDYCIVAIRHRAGEVKYGTGKFPPFTRGVWAYFKMTKQQGWKVTEMATRPPGWIEPTYGPQDEGW